MSSGSVSLASGRYQIINMIAGSNGDNLAITFNGEGSKLLMSVRQNIPQQMWFVSPGNSSSPQFIVPVLAEDLWNAPAGNYVTPNETQYRWYITGDLGVYVIQNTDQTLFWSLDTVAVGAPVTLQGGTVQEVDEENWFFIESN